MNAPTRSYSHKGQTLQTAMSLSEAAKIIESKGNMSAFASDMVRAQRSCRISPAQQFFLIKLAMEAKGEIKSSRPAIAGISVGAGFMKIAEMFSKAIGKLKFPKIKFDMESGKMVLSPAKAASANPGAIYVKLNGEYMGKVTNQGIFAPVAACPDSIKEYLAEFADNPAQVAKVYGQRTGRCCFCGIELSTNESLHAGYGPICAENYGLPWGEVN